MNEASEELAGMHAFELLEGKEAHAFEARLLAEPALRQAFDELRETVAALAYALPERALPSDLEARVHSALRASHSSLIPSPFRLPGWVPWALAASLLTACVLLAFDRARYQERLAHLERKSFVAENQIAMLSSKLESAPKATAVILWDAERQEGVLKVSDVPAAARDRDYQLWVVDPQYKQPVDAGVFAVDRSGATRITFKPKTHVQSAQAFAVSLERKGGATKAEGPMVLVGK